MSRIPVICNAVQARLARVATTMTWYQARGLSAESSQELPLITYKLLREHVREAVGLREHKEITLQIEIAVAANGEEPDVDPDRALATLLWKVHRQFPAHESITPDFPTIPFFIAKDAAKDADPTWADAVYEVPESSLTLARVQQPLTLRFVESL